jgi:hypothetical protein
MTSLDHAALAPTAAGAAPTSLRVIAGALGLALFVSAVVMLFDPRLWYDTLPGVSSSGPLNAHFARDIGCANLVAAVVLLVRALRRTPPASALVAVAAFLCLHAAVHAWELSAAGHEAGHRVLRDFSTVYLPAILTASVAIDAVSQSRTQPGA